MTRFAEEPGADVSASGGHRFWRRAGLPSSRPGLALAGGVIIAFLVCLGLIAIWRVLNKATETWQIFVGIGYLAGLITLQIWLFGAGDRKRPDRVAIVVVLAQTALVFVPFMQFPWWLGLPGILAGAVLLLLPPRLGIPLMLLVVTATGVIGAARAEGGAAAPGGGGFNAVFDSATTLMTGLAVYGLTRLAELVYELHQARGELARLAVADERLRFAQDLQDLLGIRLSAIVARTERIQADTLDKPVEEVQSDLGDVLDTSRKALADVRSVARGYRRLSLDAELAGARSVLTAAEVDLRVERFEEELPEPLGTVLAVVLREAVTNVVRHSAARRCEIVLRNDDEGVHMEVVNDGVGTGGTDGGSDGVSAVARQVRGLGGELTAGVAPDGRYRLRVSIPHGGAKSSGVDESPGGVPAVSRRLANGVIAAVFLCFATIILADVLINQRDVTQAAIGSGYIAAVVGIQAGYFIRSISRDRTGLSLILLAVQGLLVYLPVVQYGGLWLTMPSFLAANALLVLRPALSVPVTIGVLASVGWIYSGSNPNPVDVAGEVVWALTNVVVVYGLTRLARLVADLNRAHSELARMAVAAERLRFARDVHDLLGLSLSAVTLKAELANRLLASHPERAKEQLVEIVALSRKAIGDVRSVASGYQEFQLDEELDSARSVLSSAEIDVRISGFDFEIPEPQSTVLATVAREGVTNVLRHSKAERCEITVQKASDVVRMEIVNDGLTQLHPEPSQPTVGNGAVGAVSVENGGGNGIRNLTHRVTEVGGNLAVGVEPNGTYRLRAVLPLQPA